MTRTSHLRRLLPAASLLAAILALGACGEDAADEATPDAASEAATADAEATGGSAGDAVRIVDFDYAPGELEVEAGTAVTFTNEDGFAHTVTAKDKSFDSGNLDEGGTFEHTFAEAGTFEYLCAIHNSMTGKVVVS